MSLSSVAAGSADDYGIQVTATDTAGKAASFTFDFSSTTGGTNGSTTGNYPVYTYSVPPGGYAPNGNLLAHSDSVMGDWAFQYDTLNRLTVMAPSNNAPSADSISLGCYAYDAFGNRTLESLSSVPCNGGNPTPQTANAYNPVNNQLSSSTLSSLTLAAGSIGYDASGNETFDGRNYYWYDAEGRLCTVASASAVQNSNLNGFWQYGYDALGNRFVSGHPAAAPAANASCAPPLGTGYSMQKRYLVGLGGDQVTELSEASGETWLHSNVWMGPKPLATYDTSGIQFYISDPLGTKRIGVNALGVISKTCLSLPYGNDVGNPVAANCTGDNSDEHHFTGKERDAESGNDYFGARYYASSMGRFLSPDPKMISKQRMVDPQQWNMYEYSKNNPIAFFDLDGKEVRAVDAAALNNIRMTLPASVRSSVVTDQNGFISHSALNAVKSSDANVQALQHMVNAKSEIDVMTGPSATNKAGKSTDPFKYESDATVRADLVKLGVTPTAGQDYTTNFSGITYGANESQSGNIEVHVSDGTGAASTIPGIELDVTTGHEL